MDRALFERLPNAKVVVRGGVGYDNLDVEAATDCGIVVCNVIDYGFIRHRIRELRKVYKIREIGADPWNVTQILQQLQEDDGFRVVEVRREA